MFMVRGLSLPGGEGAGAVPPVVPAACVKPRRLASNRASRCVVLFFGATDFFSPVLGSTTDAFCVLTFVITCRVAVTASLQGPSKSLMWSERHDKIPPNRTSHHLSMPLLQRKGTDFPTSARQPAEIVSAFLP